MKARAVSLFLFLTVTAAWLALLPRLKVTTAITHFMPDGADRRAARIAREIAEGEIAGTLVLDVSGDEPERLAETTRALLSEIRALPETGAVRSGVDEAAGARLFELLGGRLDRKLVALGLSFLLGAGGFVALGAWAVGPPNVREHFENMMDHNSAEQLSSRRIGFAMALPFRGDLEPKNISKEIKAKTDEQKPLRFGIAMIVLAGYAWGLRNKRDDEAFAYGWIPFFLLTTASYYYYVVRVVLIAHHAGEIDRLRNRVGLVILLALEAMTNFIEVHFVGHRVFLVGCLAWGSFLYALVMLGFLVVDEGEPRKARA